MEKSLAVVLARPDSVDLPECSRKRLYVRKAFRRFGLGRQLAEMILTARMVGYQSVLLDTLNDMESARTVFRPGL
jgi:GNAT superfamily N-acetyltransferase